MNTPRRWPLWLLRPLLGAAAAVALVVGGMSVFFDGEGDQEAPPARISEAPLTVPLSTNHWPGDGN
ncbi:hypothetical protein [Nocardia sp. NPDC005366]|uniref:hypothetical protein n=1 Tax=Nocardia sp. NPDC005366 TaxID=3156878 RepID=UPI0033A54745